MSVQWASPLWLWLLVPLALAALALRRARLPAAAHPAGPVRAPRAASLLASFPEALRALALLLLVLALAGPRSVAAVEARAREGVPMVVALDISSSMLAQDFRPRDRLAVAKQTVARFVAARRDDPIGLVAFAGEAVTVVPITTYDPLLLQAIEGLQVGLLEDGTAIGEGLATAVNRLRQVEAEDRVVILMSDGESNRGSVAPLEAARAAAAFGIRVYTIGIGSEGTARVPVERAPGGLRYAERPVEIDEALLREVAALTGGEYFRAINPEALRAIYARIDRLVASPVEARTFVRYREWYPWLLLAAAALLAAEWLVRGSRWGVVP